MLCKVTHYAGCISANTRPHQPYWSEREMRTGYLMHKIQWPACMSYVCTQWVYVWVHVERWKQAIIFPPFSSFLPEHFKLAGPRIIRGMTDYDLLFFTLDDIAISNSEPYTTVSVDHLSSLVQHPFCFHLHSRLRCGA